MTKQLMLVDAMGAWAWCLKVPRGSTPVLVRTDPLAGGGTWPRIGWPAGSMNVLCVVFANRCRVLAAFALAELAGNLADKALRRALLETQGNVPLLELYGMHEVHDLGLQDHLALLAEESHDGLEITDLRDSLRLRSCQTKACTIRRPRPGILVQSAHSFLR